METGRKSRRFWITLGGVLVAVVALLVTLIPLAGHAEAPQRINYQGYLTDSGGDPLNGSYEMGFAVYDAVTDGTELWSETQTVTVTQGLFSVQLGSDTAFPSDLFDGVQRYLQIVVAGDVLSPRQRLVSAPYSISAGDAETLDGLDSTAFLNTGNDYGRPGVATDLFEGGATLTQKYVNASGDGIGGNLVVVGTVTTGGFQLFSAYGLPDGGICADLGR